MAFGLVAGMSAGGDGRVQETGGAAGWPDLHDGSRVIAAFSTEPPGQPSNPLMLPRPLAVQALRTTRAVNAGGAE